MNRNDFLRMIENSGPSDRQMIVEVNELINVFPYFQSAYLLLLKGLQNTADVKFENKLRTYANHIADREVLYYFIKKETLSAEKSEEKITVEVLQETEGNSDSQQTVIDSAKNSQDFIDGIERNMEGRTTNDSLNERQVMISTDSGFDGSDATILLMDEGTGSVEERIIYMDPGFSVPEEPDLLEIETDENKIAEGHDNPTGTIKDSVEASVSTRQRQSELIDKFIIESPRIEPVREKSDKPIKDISKAFTEEHGSFVSETLAKIYIKQGYYSKAIDIFEKLCLKFPEKSSYFASQIEKVKELIKK
jgi:hypothetical protein